MRFRALGEDVMGKLTTADCTIGSNSWPLLVILALSCDSEVSTITAEYISILHGLSTWPCDLFWPVRWSGWKSEPIPSAGLDRSWCVSPCSLVPLPLPWEYDSISPLVPRGGRVTPDKAEPILADLWALNMSERAQMRSAELSGQCQPRPAEL